MKQIYSIITLAAATLTASAATPTAIAPAIKATTATPQVKGMTAAQSRLQIKNQITPLPKQQVYFDGEEEEVWTSLGTGNITAAFLEPFGLATPTYPIEIEETPIEGGRKFRCLPFTHEDNPFASLFGFEDFDEENYMVFYAMDNGKNYFEDFDGYGVIPFSQYTAENGWQEPSTGYIYATFDGETWTVPCGGVLTDLTATGNSGWYRGNSKTPLSIAFPGAKDYSCAIQTWICGEDIPGGVPEGNVQAFLFQGAEDASYVKFGYLSGYWNFTMNMAEFVGLYGTKYDAGKTVRCGIPESTKPGIYTAYVATFDAEDNCKDIKSSYFFVLDDDQDNWTKVGTATWNESLYSGSYNNWNTQQLTMDYEEHKEIPGYFRLVNPYAAAMTSEGESLSAPCVGHNHYIYIDATVADQVKIEPSVTGGVYDGRGVVMSYGHYYEQNGNDPEVIKSNGFYGTYADNKITFPVTDVVFGEKDYQNGAFLSTSVPFEVTLTPDATGITIDKTQETIKVGETVTLTVTVEPEGASAEGLVWSSSNELVATVDAEGVVTAVAVGEAIITATLGELTAECTITVEEADVTVEPTITLSKTAVEVEVGKTVTLVATVENPLATDEVPTWSTSDETVATVDSEGVVTGVTVGTATITVTYAEVSATCEVTVVDGNVMINQIIATGAAEAFDLQGRKINAAAKGLIIIRQGSKVSKAIVK